MDSFLKIRGLKKYFGDKRVLDGIDLDVAAASVTTIIGKSGIGKSVLLKCIANLLEPDAGTIELDGQAISRSRRSAHSDTGVSFSYMFQNNALFDSLTAFENVALPLREASKLNEGGDPGAGRRNAGTFGAERFGGSLPGRAFGRDEEASGAGACADHEAPSGAL